MLECVAMLAPHDPLGYSAMIHSALRGVVQQTLLQVKEIGMPADHHFYITFKTMVPQVVLPLYLRQKYPESMTIVLQHQFHNLAISDSAFSVALSFGGKFETLTVPFSAILMFSDPEAQLVFNFDPDPLPTSLDPPAAGRKNLSTIGKHSLATTTNIATPSSNPSWRGSIAFGAKSPLQPPQDAEEKQNKGRKGKGQPSLKQVETKESAKVLTFRPKPSRETHDNESPPKAP